MINWIKYDPENLPSGNTSFFVVDSEGDPWTAFCIVGGWMNDVTGDVIPNVTHYAHINLPDLPGEEDK